MTKLISVHLDDCVLSLGQYLATDPGDIEVITVLAGVPCVEGVLSDYDRSCGFTSSTTAMETRRREDADALGLLGATHQHWTYLDLQYGPDRGEDGEDLIEQIAQVYSPTELMFAPLGLGHPDHRFVARAARDAIMRRVGNEPVGLVLYEELPYRVLHPEEVVRRLAEVRAEGWDVAPLPYPLDQGGRFERAVKVDAIACYGSQFPNGADDPCLLVPERCWRVTR